MAIAATLTSGALQAAVLEEVRVTATKRTESAQDVGIAITAFTGDQMDQLGWTNAQQVTAMAPGVQTVQPNGEANYAIAMRGVASSDFTTNVESPVALYLDEVYISQMSGAGFQLFDMERVEILRGPQGTLFGRNATGGLVHYITRKPSSDANGYLKGTVGENEQYRVEGAISGGTETLSARLSGSYHNNDGYITNRYRDEDGKQSDDLNDADDKTARLHVLWAPNEDVELLLTGRWSEQDINTGFFENVSSVLPGQLTPKVPNPVLDGYLDNDGDVWAGEYDDPGYNDLKTRGYTGTLKWDFGAFRLTSITDNSTVKRDYIEDSDASPVSFFNFFLTTDADQFSQEIRLDGETDRFQWVGGVYYLDLDIDDSNGAITDPIYNAFFGPTETPGAEGGLNNPYSSELESYSVFGQVDIPLGEEFTLILGARYIDDDKDFQYNVNAVEFLDPDYRKFSAPRNVNTLIPLAEYKGSADDQEWAGRGQLDWALNDDWLIYGGWNRGIRGSGFNAPLFPFSPPLEYTDEFMAYDPETLDAYEIGFKSTLFDGLAQFNGAFYYYDYQDYQAFNIVGLDTITFNTDAESYGAELELQTSPIEGLDILMGAAYNDIEVDIGDQELPSVQSPEWNLNGLIRYEWPMFGGRMAIQGDIVWRDEVFFALVDAETLQQDSYAVSNASLTYYTEDGKWEGSVFVNNLTDEEYLVQTFDLSSLDVFGMTEQYYGRPQWWGASLTYRWGN
jgi:iron complex outermembrane receptor protein